MAVRIPIYQQRTSAPAPVPQARSNPVQVRDPTGRALAGLGDNIQEIGDRLVQAQARVQSRSDAIARVRSIGAFTEEGSTTLRNWTTEKDFTSPNAVAEYGDFLRERQQKVLEEHEGSDDSRIHLLERLDQERFKMLEKASIISTDAQRQMLQGVIGGKTNALAAQAYDDPGSIVEAFQQLDQDLADMAPSLTPHEEQSYTRVGREAIVRSALESFIDRGQFVEAQELMDDLPGINEVVSEETMRKLKGRIVSAKAEERNAATAGLAIRATLRAALGREPTEEEVRSKLGITPRASGLKAIADHTSPSGQRWVTDEEARGKPAPGNKPIVQITQLGEREVTKALGKLDAERVVTLETQAQEAFRTRAELDRMEAAMESGRFTTGAFADALHFVGRLGERLGVSDEINSFVGDAATADTLDSASNRIAVAQAEKLGRITNMSLQFIRDAGPRLMRTPSGNKILIEVMRRTADREVQIAALADEMIQRHGTLRPKNEQTFFQRMRDLEEEDPVISPELKSKIMAESDKAPKSWREVLKDKIEPQVAPKGYTPPKGFEFVRMEGDRPVIRKPGTTDEFMGPPFKGLGKGK